MRHSRITVPACVLFMSVVYGCMQGSRTGNPPARAVAGRSASPTFQSGAPLTLDSTDSTDRSDVTLGEAVGTPTAGAFGITETIDEIMARDARLTDEELRRPPRERHKHDRPDRTGLPLNPDSPQVSQWPPPEEDPAQPHDGDDDITPHNPQVVGLSFLGMQSTEAPAGVVPPDTMGDVGPTQILLCLNNRIKVISKTTGSVGALNTTTDNFFNSVRNGFFTSDPRVRFDRLTNRWFVICINVDQPNRILLAVSSGATITGMANFTFFFFQHDLVGNVPNSDTNGLFDYPSLGLDTHALYIGGDIFGAGSFRTTAHVVRKSSITGGGPIVVTPFRNLAVGTGAGPYAPQGVDNDDAAATQGYVIGVDNATFGTLMLRRISDPAGTPTITGNISLAVPSTVFPMDVTVLGTTGTLDALDDRLFAARIHKNRLTGANTMWTAQNIEVNASGVASTTGNRNGSRWYQIQNFSATPSLVQSGTLFSNAAANPPSFWIPDVAMSGQGHMALGCSMAGANQRAEIAVAGRLSGDPLGTTQAPTIAQATSFNYNLEGGGNQRWGDYSLVRVDPQDDMTMWTFQEYCSNTNVWGVRAIQLKAPLPATPASCAPSSVDPGDSGVNVVVTGTSTAGSGFFDPDAGFPNHINAAVAGGGVTVNTVTFTDPTHITLTLTVDAGASPGSRLVTVFNPDGQLAISAAGILEVTDPCATITLSPGTLPDGSLGVAYNQMITAAGGAAPYSFAVTAGSLPTGLTLAANGALSGTPTTIGTFNFTVTGTDANTCTGSQAYSVDVACPVLTITPPTLPNATNGVAYSQMLTGNGGLAPYVFLVTSGSLPSGVTLAFNGLLSGTPTETGTFNFGVDFEDSNACPGSQNFSLTVDPAGECPLPGDLTGNGQINGLDLDPFIDCLLTGSSPSGDCACGDLDGSGAVNQPDIALEVALLLAG